MHPSSARRHAPATERNREPLLAVLREALPPTGTVLELASGSGEHAVFFAPRLEPRYWLPSDLDPLAIDSIAAWRAAHPADHLFAPIRLDVTEPEWPPERQPPAPAITALVAINLIHIASWAATLGLFAGAARLLPPQGILALYGPFQRKGRHTAPSNAAFDAWLREQNPLWGVRDLDEVAVVAAGSGLRLLAVLAMPANNLTAVFSRD